MFRQEPKVTAQYLRDKTLNEFQTWKQRTCGWRDKGYSFPFSKINIDRACEKHDIRSTYPQHDENYNYWHQVKNQLKQLLNQ